MTFFVRKNDFDTAILCTSSFGRIGIDRKLLTIAFDLNAFFVDTQVRQDIGNRLRTVLRQGQIFLTVAGAVGVALDPDHAARIDLQKLHNLENGTTGRAFQFGMPGVEQHVTQRHDQPAIGLGGGQTEDLIFQPAPLLLGAGQFGFAQRQLHALRSMSILARRS